MPSTRPPSGSTSDNGRLASGRPQMGGGLQSPASVRTSAKRANMSAPVPPVPQRSAYALSIDHTLGHQRLRPGKQARARWCTRRRSDADRRSRRTCCRRRYGVRDPTAADGRGGGASGAAQVLIDPAHLERDVVEPVTLPCAMARLWCSAEQRRKHIRSASQSDNRKPRCCS